MIPAWAETVAAALQPRITIVQTLESWRDARHELDGVHVEVR